MDCQDCIELRITHIRLHRGLLLAQAGLLSGKQATTHWEDMDNLQRMFPQVQVQPKGRWVRDGNTVTSGDISAGIEMSLHLVETLVSWALTCAPHTKWNMPGMRTRERKESQRVVKGRGRSVMQSKSP